MPRDLSIHPIENTVWIQYSNTVRYSTVYSIVQYSIHTVQYRTVPVEKGDGKEGHGESG